MATQSPTQDIGAPQNGGFLEAENEIVSGGDDMLALYTVVSDCKISDFCFYQPSGGTTTVTKRIQGVPARGINLLTDSSSLSRAALAGTALKAGDVLTITHDTTAGRKGHQLLLEEK